MEHCSNPPSLFHTHAPTRRTQDNFRAKTHKHPTLVSRNGLVNLGLISLLAYLFVFSSYEALDAFLSGVLSDQYTWQGRLFYSALEALIRGIRQFSF